MNGNANPKLHRSGAGNRTIHEGISKPKIRNAGKGCVDDSEGFDCLDVGLGDCEQCDVLVV